MTRWRPRRLEVGRLPGVRWPDSLDAALPLVRRPRAARQPAEWQRSAPEWCLSRPDDRRHHRQARARRGGGAPAGLRDERGIDFVTANGENLAGGMGLTISTADALFAHGVDVITSGNHIWDKREIYPRAREQRPDPAAAQLRHDRRPGSRLGRLPRLRRHGARGHQPPGQDVHAADREPVPRGRSPAGGGRRAAAAGSPRRLPLRDHVREERPRHPSRRPGVGGRGDAHPRADRATIGSCRAAPPTRATSG